MRLDINGNPIFPEQDYPTTKSNIDVMKSSPDPVVQDYADKVEKVVDNAYEMEKIETNPNLPQITNSNPEYPEIPTIDPYDSSYKDLIESSLSDIMNYDDFTYDPKKDPSYQAYLNQMTTLGEEAFTNSLATMSSATGGMPNSWSQTVASQQQAKYLSEASANMAQFESLAYDKYLNKYNMSMDKLNTLITMDDIAYNRYIDTVNQKYQNFEYEVGRYNAQLDEIQTEINRAWDRTNTLGYVTNEDSAVLGLPPGTPSQELMLMKEEYDYYLKELKAKMAETEAQAKRDYERELDLIKRKYEIEADYLKTNIGGNDPSENPYAFLTPDEMDDIRKALNPELELIDAVDPLGEQEWSLMNDDEKIAYIGNIEDRIFSEFEHSDKSAKAEARLSFKWDMLKRKDSYHTLYKPYIDEQIRVNSGMSLDSLIPMLEAQKADRRRTVIEESSTTIPTKIEKEIEEEIKEASYEYNEFY
jgi:hypothetical protein